MSVRYRLRDAIRSMVPRWLSDRDQNTGTGLFRGFGVIFTLAAAADSGIDTMIQGIRAAWPGDGTPTALPFIGRNRGILRGESDTDDAYGARLVQWLSTWRGDLPAGGGAGSQYGLAKQIHEYLGNHPRVRVVNRHGVWTTVNSDGSVTVVKGVPFDWDSVSNPENSSHWWDEWIIVYSPEWPEAAVWGPSEFWGPGDGTALGFGVDVYPQPVDALLSIIRSWKAERTYIRELILCYDDTLFDPAIPASLPDGTWGKWHTLVGGVSVPSGRNVTACRYLEP